MNLIDKLKLALTGHAYVEHRTRSGWTAPLPFYAFKCEKHGLVENYPSGHHQRLLCPQCQAERKRTDPQKICADEPPRAKSVHGDEET